jgi:hypothetical protein
MKIYILLKIQSLEWCVCRSVCFCGISVFVTLCLYMDSSTSYLSALQIRKQKCSLLTIFIVL